MIELIIMLNLITSVTREKTACAVLLNKMKTIKLLLQL